MANENRLIDAKENFCSLTLKEIGITNALFAVEERKTILAILLILTTAPTAVQRWMVIGMANNIKKGESLFIPFKNGESIYDSQLKPRMYKTKEQYDRFSYHFKDAEMVEYAEVVRCKDCKNWGGVIYGGRCKYWSSPIAGMTHFTSADDFCSRGERKDNETD